MVTRLIHSMAFVMVIALAGCSGGGSAPSQAPSTGPSSPSAASTSASPTPPTTPEAPTPSPSGGTLTGTMTFEFPQVDFDLDAVVEPTGCSFMGVGDIRVADPRIAGSYRTVLCWDEKTPDDSDYTGVWVIWNDGGTWEGRYTGTIDAARNHEMDLVNTGTGDYAGLRLDVHATAGADDSVWACTFEVVTDPRATLAPAPVGPASGATAVTGTHTCATTIFDPTQVSVGDITRQRGEVLICTWAVSDPRLAGSSLEIASADVHRDGSAAGRGTLATRVGDGKWLGTYTLERAADGTSTVRTSLTGSLAYEGLVYQDVQVGTGDTWQVTGWIAEAE